jgi:biotin operon repressor
MASDLPQMAAHLGHVLAAMADNKTGRVAVSLSELARRAHMARSSVMKHLDVLEAEGFIIRDRPDRLAARRHHEMTAYTTTIPAGYPTTSTPSYKAEARPAPDLGLGREDGKARPRDDLGLGRLSRRARPPHGHRSIDLSGATPDASASGAAHTWRDDGSGISCVACGLPSRHASHEVGT